MKQAERSVFGRNLRAFRENADLTQPQIAKALGVTTITENRWENQGIQPRRIIIDTLMRLYGLSEDDLLSDSNGYYAKLHGLTEAPIGAIGVKPSAASIVPVRMLGAAHAGDLDEQWEFDDEIFLYEELANRHPSCFALRVNGNCMNKNFTDKDYVFVDPDIEPTDGCIAVACIDGEAVIRRVKKGNNSLILVAESTKPEYEDIIIQGEGITVEYKGVVFWWQSKKELQ